MSIRSATIAAALVFAVSPALANEGVNIDDLSAHTNQEMSIRVVVRGSTDGGVTTYEEKVSSVRACFDHVRVTTETVRGESNFMTVVSGVCQLPNGDIPAAFSCSQKGGNDMICRRIR